MSDASTKPLVFISYARPDEPEKPVGDEVKWFSFVQRFLQPAEKSGIFEIWVDRQMKGGADWVPEIEAKLRACDIFILLVSPTSMASDYIDKEITIIRERQKKGEPVHFYPLLLTPTPKAGLEKVKDKNLRPRNAKPFSVYSAHDRAQHMTEVADEIAEIAEGIARRKSAARLAAGQDSAAKDIAHALLRNLRELSDDAGTAPLTGAVQTVQESAAAIRDSRGGGDHRDRDAGVGGHGLLSLDIRTLPVLEIIIRPASARVAWWRKFEPALREAAKQRQREHSGTASGRAERLRDEMKRVTGKGGRTVEKEIAIVKAAEQDPAKYGHLVEQMDRNGADGVYKQLRNMLRAERDSGRPHRPGLKRSVRRRRCAASDDNTAGSVMAAARPAGTG